MEISTWRESIEENRNSAGTWSSVDFFAYLLQVHPWSLDSAWNTGMCHQLLRREREVTIMEVGDSGSCFGYGWLIIIQTNVAVILFMEATIIVVTSTRFYLNAQFRHEILGPSEAPGYRVIVLVYWV
jgi:hypothetical protein